MASNRNVIAFIAAPILPTIVAVTLYFLNFQRNFTMFYFLTLVLAYVAMIAPIKTVKWLRTNGRFNAAYWVAMCFSCGFVMILLMTRLTSGNFFKAFLDETFWVDPAVQMAIVALMGCGFFSMLIYLLAEKKTGDHANSV